MICMANIDSINSNLPFLIAESLILVKTFLRRLNLKVIFFEDNFYIVCR